MNPLKVILASSSPRRRQFLSALGVAHTTAVANIDESPLPGEQAEALATRLAQCKALTVANQLPTARKPALVIGADTVVALDGRLLGKPQDAEQAAAMLTSLRGRMHQVHSALAVVHIDHGVLARRVTVNTTHVTMRAYSDTEIAVYVATGNPLDKAGGYAIQHRGFEPVERLDGCPAGVMGLPVADLLALLAEFGVVVDCPVAQVCQQLTGLPCCQQSVISSPCAVVRHRA